MPNASQTLPEPGVSGCTLRRSSRSRKHVSYRYVTHNGLMGVLGINISHSICVL